MWLSQWSSLNYVRTVVRNVKLIFIGCSGSNHSVFFLCRVTFAGSSSNPPLCTCVSVKGVWLAYGIFHSLHLEWHLAGTKWDLTMWQGKDHSSTSVHILKLVMGGQSLKRALLVMFTRVLYSFMWSSMQETQGSWSTVVCLR